MDEPAMTSTTPRIRHLALAFGVLYAVTASAGTLPDERADVMWRMYDGGGIKVQGPSVLVRKSVTDNVSVNAGYAVDQVSGASIDMVVLGASPLREERKQKSLGVDYLYGKTTYSAGVQSSTENDYDSRTASFNLSQDMFGDLTTVKFGVSKGWDHVYRVMDAGLARDPGFNKRLDRRTWSLGITQVLTRNLILSYDQDVITESGYLQNPYRAIRYLAGPGSTLFLTSPEMYPGTRTSTAAALKLKYYTPWKGAASAQYRYFYDTWKIRASTTEVGYTQPLRRDAMIADLTYRHYQQGHASFYSDLFSSPNQQNYMARDRELAGQSNDSVGLAVSYDFLKSKRRFFKKFSGSLHYDYIMYKFDDFRDASQSQAFGAGNEPMYKYNANVVQAFLTVWF
jgi:hypothetical protein